MAIGVAHLNGEAATGPHNHWSRWHYLLLSQRGIYSRLGRATVGHFLLGADSDERSAMPAAREALTGEKDELGASEWAK